MKIAVISTDCGLGRATVSATIAHAIAKSGGADVLLTYAGEVSPFNKILNCESDDTGTRSISLISKLIQSNSFGLEGIRNYCPKIIPNLYYLDTTLGVYKREEVESSLEYVLSNNATDVVVCDVSLPMEDELTTTILEYSDVIILVTNPGLKYLENARRLLEDYDAILKEKCALFINRYSEDISSTRAMAATVGIEHRNTCKLHYNPYFITFSNKGNLSQIYDLAYVKDIRALSLFADIKEILSFVSARIGRKLKWGVQKE